MTDFKDILIKYMEELDCSSKELADSSGLSAATISRYRSGERIPDVESDNLKQLICGIVKLAQKRNLSSIRLQPRYKTIQYSRQCQVVRSVAVLSRSGD